MGLWPLLVIDVLYLETYVSKNVSKFFPFYEFRNEVIFGFLGNFTTKNKKTLFSYKRLDDNRNPDTCYFCEQNLFG